jgi:CheY-like chemotaxis protein
MGVKPLKIAVVDDDQIYQFIMLRTLNKIDPEIIILNFSNCGDMFTFLKRNADKPQLLPDIILLDLNTRFMNGWEFLLAHNSIKDTLLKDSSIYMISSSVDPNDRHEASLYTNLSGFCSKPLKPEQLIEIIQSVMIKGLGG